MEKVTLNFSVQTSTLQFFVQLHNALSFLFFDPLKNSVTVKLQEWNNNCGVEFDMLQKLFPAKIPLAGELQFSNELPTAEFTKLSELVLFCCIACQVDASFQVSSDLGECFSVHDGCIQIETGRFDKISKDFFSN